MTGDAVRLVRGPTGAVAGALLVAAFVIVGGLGVYRYGENFWLYRAFAPPAEATFVRVPGVEQQITVASPALGGRRQQVVVYLPPGYAQSPHRRYPVLYLLHGFPGRPLAFLETVRMGVVEDALVARGKAQPLILVMPFGSTGTFTDEEWVDGAGSHQGWGTFVARDLVRAVDARYRTIRSGRGRAIGGLSEGGYGAIDIALRHPGEFTMVESWSGYERPDKLRSIFGAHLGLLAANDPMTALPRLAPRLRALGTRFWIYSGRSDPLRTQNEQFAAELARARIPHDYFEARGGHNWALWRAHAAQAYLAAARRLAHG
jgi:enterochelin esterase-like enzyme